MADDNPSRTILTKPPNQERVQMDENVRLITNLNRLLEDLKRAANELLVRGIIFEFEMEELKAAIESFYNDPDMLRNRLQELNSRLHEFGYEISDVGGGSDDLLDGYVQEMVNLGVQCQVEMLKLKDAIAVVIRNLLIGLNLVLDDSSCDPGNLDSKYSSSGLSANLKNRACDSMMRRTEERVLENVSIPMSPNVAAGTRSLGSESESVTESTEKLISTTTSMECGEETAAEGSVSFNLRDDTTSSEDKVEDDHQEANNEDSNGEEEGSTSSNDEEAAANDPMNNSLESGLYTNIEGLAEEMNELLRKMNEDNEDEDEDHHQSSKAITLKNLKRSLFRKPPGDL